MKPSLDYYLGWWGRGRGRLTGISGRATGQIPAEQVLPVRWPDHRSPRWPPENPPPRRARNHRRTVAQWARMQLNCAKIIFNVIIFENWGFKGNLTRRIWLEYFQSCMTSSWYRFLIGRLKYEQFIKYVQLFSIQPCVEEFFIHLFCGKFKFGHEFQ